ncbi:oligosaccharide flippase family protein, partial [Akkermansiaceae bacterium]|nr:oligosaccharide flippase family protein [Akkermansiaceae bacterium]
GAAYLTLSSILSRVIALLSFSILTHLLMPSAYGVAALATSLASLLAIFGVAGQDTSLTRNYHNDEEFDSGTIARFFEQFGILSGFVFGLVGMLCWFGYNGWVFERKTLVVCGILALTIWGTVVSIFRMTVARLNFSFGRLSIVRILASVVGVALSIGVAVSGQTNEIAILVVGLTSWFVVALLPKSKRRQGDEAKSLADFSRLVRVGLPMIFTATGFWIIASLDRWFLSSYADLESVGIYSIGVTIGTLGQMVTSSLVSVWNPAVFSNFKGKDLNNKDSLSHILTVFLWILMTTWVGISIFGGLLIQFLAPAEFHSAIAFVPWIGLAYMIYGFGQMFGFGFLMHRKTVILAWFWGIAVIVSLALNFTLVPHQKIEGAIVAQLAAFTVLTTLTWVIGRQWTPIQPCWPALLTVFVIYIIAIFAMSQVTATGALFLDVLISIAAVGGSILISGWVVVRNIGISSLSDLRSILKQKN